MVDPDKDRTNPKVGSGQRAGDPPVTGASSQSTSGMRAGSSGQSKASQMADDAKQQAKSLASQAAEQGKSALNQQKDSAAQRVDNVGGAFRHAADELQEKGQSQTGYYVGMVADQLESLGQQLRNKDANSLIRDAENLSRRSPMLFFGGALLAGFALSRFMKSSAQHSYADYERGYDGEYSGGYGGSRMRGDQDDDTGYSWRNEMGEGDSDINIGRNRTRPLDTEGGGMAAGGAASGTLGGQWGAGTTTAGPEITGIYRPSEAQGAARPGDSKASAPGVELPGSAQPSVSADGKPQPGRPGDAIGGSSKST